MTLIDLNRHARAAWATVRAAEYARQQRPSADRLAELLLLIVDTFAADPGSLRVLPDLDLGLPIGALVRIEVNQVQLTLGIEPETVRLIAACPTCDALTLSTDLHSLAMLGMQLEGFVPAPWHRCPALVDLDETLSLACSDDVVPVEFRPDTRGITKSA